MMQMIVYKETAHPLDKELESRFEGGDLGNGKWKEYAMSDVSQLIDEWNA